MFKEEHVAAISVGSSAFASSLLPSQWAWWSGCKRVDRTNVLVVAVLVITILVVALLIIAVPACTQRIQCINEQQIRLNCGHQRQRNLTLTHKRQRARAPLGSHQAIAPSGPPHRRTADSAWAFICQVSGGCRDVASSCTVYAADSCWRPPPVLTCNWSVPATGECQLHCCTCEQSYVSIYDVRKDKTLRVACCSTHDSVLP